MGSTAKPRKFRPSAERDGVSGLYERVVREAMERLRMSRKRAELAAQKLKKRVKPETVVRKLDAISVSTEPAKPITRRPPGAKKRVKNTSAQAEPQRTTVQTAKKSRRSKLRRLTREEIAKLPPVKPPRPKPKTALERLERAMGPDDGRRRGGSPTVQGGSPGLGKRR